MVADPNAARRRARRRIGTTGASGALGAARSATPPAREGSRRGGLRAAIAACAFGVAAAVVLPFAAQAGNVDPVTSIRDVLIGADAQRDDRGASIGDATTAAAQAPPEMGAEGVEISIAPTISTTFTPGAAGSTVSVSVELANLSGSFLEAGTLELVRAGSPIDDPDELDTWLAGVGATSGFEADATPLAESTTRPLAAGGVTQVAFTVPAESDHG